MNLYRVSTKLPSPDYWSVAKDYTEAANKVSDFLNKHDYGFTNDRKVVSVTLIAEGITDERFITGKHLIL